MLDEPEYVPTPNKGQFNHGSGKASNYEVGLSERQYSDKGQLGVSGESGREQKAKFLLRTLSGALVVLTTGLQGSRGEEIT